MTLYAPAGDLWERVLARVEKQPSGCWTWQGAVNSRGYGQICSGKRSRSVLTHRLAVIVRDGALDDDMTVDHTCHDSYECSDTPCPHRRCVNPDHLAVVTRVANLARQWDRDTCRKGHQLSTRANGSRRCRTCANEYAAAWRAARALASERSP